MLQHYLREMKILILNSGSLDLLLLQDILASDGYLHHKGFTDAALMRSLLQDFTPDLVMLGAAPCCETIEILGELRADLQPNHYLPALVVTSAQDSVFKRNALAAGATDFLHLPLDHTEVLLRVHNLLYARHLYVQLSHLDWHRDGDGGSESFNSCNGNRKNIGSDAMRKAKFSLLKSCSVARKFQFQMQSSGLMLSSRAW